jgi:hypothetical protein
LRTIVNCHGYSVLLLNHKYTRPHNFDNKLFMDYLAIVQRFASFYTA